MKKNIYIFQKLNIDLLDFENSTKKCALLNSLYSQNVIKILRWFPLSRQKIKFFEELKNYKNY